MEEDEPEYKSLFEDPAFLCEDSSLFSDYSTPIARFQDDITWLRPQVVPPAQPQWGERGYRGSFLFRLWQHGRWTEVTVDDRLPCLGGKLCFSRCQSPTAFWVALLEKAYAKLQGSYEHLWAGQVSEALVDLTGGLAERWSLGDGGTEEDQGRGSSDSDWVRRRRLDLDLLHAVREGCLVSCSVHSAPGVINWPLSPGSGEGWNSLDPTCTLNLLGRAQEAEFWVDETEFLLQFDDVTVWYPINEEGHLQSIYSGELLTHSHQTGDRWVKGHSAGGCRNNSSYGSNPQFWLQVFERGEVLVSLLQHRRYSRNTGRHYTQSPEEGSSTTQHQHYQAIALHMWKVENKRLNLSGTLNSPPCASTHCHAYEREVVLHTHLDPGFHLLIPSTFLQGGEGSFLLRVFSSSPTSLSAVKTPGPSLPLVTEGEWETIYLRGAWVTGSSAGGSRNFLSHWQNPRFPVTMGDNLAGSTGVNAPEGQGKAESTVPREEEPVASCIPHCYTQAVSLACCLPPGAYVIVPSTYHPDSPGQFTLTMKERVSPLYPCRTLCVFVCARTARAQGLYPQPGEAQGADRHLSFLSLSLPFSLSRLRLAHQRLSLGRALMGADGAGRCKQTVAIEEARSLCSLAGPSARDKGPTHGAPCWGREGRSKGSDLTTLQCTHPASDPNPRAACD
ncbi:unnamed protein product [Coregonus sp. 'balchen']|nr:unnamed protein product [Coregonus sp. 'balchen']